MKIQPTPTAKGGLHAAGTFVVAIAMATFLSVLVFLNYSSAKGVRKAFLEQARRETEKRAMSLEHFFSERRDDLVEVAHSRELSVYFENKALGMSMDYGLRQSLPPIREKFKYYLEGKQIGSDPMYSRFVLLEKDGSLLVDSSRPDRTDPDKSLAGLLLPDSAQGVVLAGKDSGSMLVSAAYYFKGAYAGQVVAWINGDCLYRHLLGGGGKGQEEVSLLLHSDRLSSPTLNPDESGLEMPPPDSLKAGVSLEYRGRAGELLATCERVEGTPLCLLRIISTEGALGWVKPWKLLLAMSLLGVAIMCGAVLSVRLLVRSRELGVRLVETEAREREVSEKNTLLEQEIVERQRAQECFSILRMAMEDVPLDSILDTAIESLSGLSWLETTGYCAIKLYEPRDGILRTVSWKGVELGSSPCCNETMPGDCLCGKVALERESLFIESSSPEHPVPCKLEEPHSHYCVPMLYGQQLVGVLNLTLKSCKEPGHGAKQFIDSFVNILSFIVQRRRADEELRLAHQANKSLIDSMPMALLTLDSNGRVLRFNPSAGELFGIRPAELIGRELKACPIKWEYDAIAKGIDEAADSQKVSAPLETRFTRGDGQDGFLSVSVCPLADSGSDSARMLIVASDITARKTLESQLMLAQRLEAVGELAAGIAHEINTPIQYIGSNLQFLQDSFELLMKYTDDTAPLLEPEAQREAAERNDLEFIRNDMPKALEESLHGVSHVAEIIKAMKEFSHPGSQERAPADINAILSNTITVTRNEWKYAAEVKANFDSSLPNVPCISGEMRQAFLNIIINAAHAIAEKSGGGTEKGLIEITTRRDGDMAEIVIRDSGCGIPESIKSRIFDPFFTTKQVGKGTGQGLAIARNVIVKKHGGELSFESENGKGTSFIIRLPLNPPPAS